MKKRMRVTMLSLMMMSSYLIEQALGIITYLVGQLITLWLWFSYFLNFFLTLFSAYYDFNSYYGPSFRNYNLFTRKITLFFFCASLRKGARLRLGSRTPLRLSALSAFDNYGCEYWYVYCVSPGRALLSGQDYLDWALVECCSLGRYKLSVGPWSSLLSGR